MRLELQARTELTLKLLHALDALDMGARLRAAELGGHIGTSATYVAHLVTPLIRAGLVQSTPGPTGGYELVPGAESPSLLALIELVEGPTDSTQCVMADRDCGSTTRCALHDAWMRARAALTAELDAIPIDTIATHNKGVLQ